MPFTRPESEHPVVDYSDNPDFNRQIDEQNNVEVLGFSFSASEVLYGMNYDQYYLALQDFLSDSEELKQEVMEEFPTPIAFYFQQALENSDNSNHKLDLLKSTWEAIIFTLYGLVIGEAVHRKLSLREIGTKAKEYFSDRLDTRLSIIESILNYCATNGYDFKVAKIVSPATIAMIKRLNQERNGFEHTAAKTPQQADELIQELLPELIKVLSAVRELKNVVIIRFHSTPDLGVLWPRCEIFKGQKAKKESIQLDKTNYSDILEYFSAQFVFAQYEKLAFCLAPFVHFHKLAAEPHPNLCFHKKSKQAEGKYRFEISGKSKEIDLEKTVFNSRLAVLASLIDP